MIDLRHGDCLTIMKSFPDKHFDLIVTDPPYGINRDGQGMTVCKNPKHNRRKHESGNWDGEIPSEEYFSEMFRVSKNQIIWGGNYFTQFLPKSMGWIFWDKGQDLSMSDGELAFTSFDKALRRVVINRSELVRDGVIHPTQKPIKLIQFCFKYAGATKGMKILDPFMGSGTTAIVSHNNEFDFVGIERDEKHYSDAVNRYENYKSQYKLAI